MVPFFASQTFV